MTKRSTVIVGIVLTAVLVLGACSKDQNELSQTQRKQIDKQNEITKRLTQTQPVPDITYSADRQALIERYKRTNNQAFRQYIAIYTNQGQLIYTGVVKGKVTPLDSQVTPADGLDCQHYGDRDPRPDGCGVVQVAEPNGTWGTNGVGVFWFDDRGVMHESGGFPYLLSDQPFQTASAPLLVIAGQTPVGG